MAVTTMAKAIKVPMEMSSPSRSSGSKPATMEHTRPVRIVAM